MGPSQPGSRAVADISVVLLQYNVLEPDKLIPFATMTDLLKVRALIPPTLRPATSRLRAHHAKELL